MHKMYFAGLCLLIGAVTLCTNAAAMNKAELIDAIASKSGLSKADSKRALDGFINATTKALASGGRVALTDFGVLSVSTTAANTDGCSSESTVEFYASSLFDASEKAQETPFAMRVGEVVEQADGTLWVFGPSTDAALAYGDDLVLRKRPGRKAAGDPDDDDDGLGDGVEVDFAGVLYLADDGTVTLAPAKASDDVTGEIILEEGREMLGVAIAGIEKTDIRRGMVIAKPGIADPNPTGRCGDGEFDGPIFVDADIVEGMANEARLTKEAVDLAYNALLDTVIEVVNSGEEVDLEGFGAFYEEGELTVTAAPRKGRNPQTGKEIQIAAKNVSQGEQQQIIAKAEQLARKWEREGGGTEVTTTKKKVVKFKAGADLSGSVN